MDGKRAPHLVFAIPGETGSASSADRAGPRQHNEPRRALRRGIHRSHRSASARYLSSNPAPRFCQRSFTQYQRRHGSRSNLGACPERDRLRSAIVRKRENGHALQPRRGEQPRWDSAWAASAERRKPRYSARHSSTLMMSSTPRTTKTSPAFRSIRKSTPVPIDPYIIPRADRPQTG